MRRRESRPEFSHEEPPRELLRFVPSERPPVAPDGRPMSWAVEWTAEEFAAFLRARAAWRDSHSRPLPGLPARERVATSQLGIPQALINAEHAASRGAPSPPFEQAAEHRPASPTFSTIEGIS